jgi:uncharacterized protein YgiM (DUF1202 family)
MLFIRGALFSLVFASGFLVAAEAENSPITGTVKASKLNVRVKPGAKFSVVSSLNRGDKVEILGKEGDWFKIKAPEKASVWVASPFIKDGKVEKEVNMRSGPGIAYSSYGTLPVGATVNIINDKAVNWVKITPPVGTVAWISARYVDVPKEEKKENVIDAATLKPEAVDKKTGSENDGIGLPFIPGSAKSVAVEGILLPLDPSAKYVTHALATKVKEEYFPVCYLHSGKMNLKLWEKRRIRVNGEQKWVKNWKRPVVEVERITPMWE